MPQPDQYSHKKNVLEHLFLVHIKVSYSNVLIINLYCA